MTYRTLSSIAAALLFVLAGACDSDGDASEEDAGPDTAGSQAAKEQKQKKKSAEKDQKDRPSASSEESGTLHDQPPPKLDGLIDSDDLKQLTGSASYETTELPGRDPSPNYNARRFKPKGGSGYGAGVQVWTFEKAGKAQARLKDFRSQYLNTEDVPEAKREALGSGAFVSTRGGIRNVVFAVGEPPAVAALSCSTDTCNDKQNFLDFAVRVQSRISNRSGSNGSEKGGGSEESGSEKSDKSGTDGSGKGGENGEEKKDEKKADDESDESGSE